MQEVTIKVDEYYTGFNGKDYTITAVVAEQVMQNYKLTVLQEVTKEIASRITNKWVELYGQEVLNQLAPDAVAEAIRTKVTQKVMETLGVK